MDDLTAGLEIYDDGPQASDPARLAAVVRGLAEGLDARHALDRRANRALAEEILACLEAEEVLAEKVLTPLVEAVLARVARRVIVEQLRAVQAGPPLATKAQADLLRSKGHEAGPDLTKAEASRLIDQLRKNGWRAKAV